MIAPRFHALHALAAAALLAVSPVRAQAPTSYQYVMKPGDTLIGLARAFFVRPEDYRAVATANSIADVYRIPVGTRLAIPRAVLRNEPIVARVASFRGAATLAGAAPHLGDPVREGMAIETGPAAALSFTLGDGTIVSLPSQSRLLVRRLRRVLISGETERLFTLQSGRSLYDVVPRAAPGNRFEVQTPVAVAAVRGTEFRVSLDQAATTASTEVLRGEVGVDGVGGIRSVPSGYGLRSDAQTVGVVMKLLPPPILVMPIRIQPDGREEASFRPAPGEVRYRLQIARDEDFADILDEAEGSGPALLLRTLPPGNYYLRATAIDAAGLEGEPAFFEYQHAAPPPATTGATPGRG